MSARAELLELLVKQSLRKGDFVLSSGAKSTYYIDARRTTLHPTGLRLIGRLGYEEIQRLRWPVTAVGGLTMGADPIAYAISYHSADADHAIHAFTVRKEPKAHGMGKQVEGPVTPHDAYVVIEDVITTGASAMKAVEAVRQFGGVVHGVLALVDRDEGGRTQIESLGVPVASLFRVGELLAH